MRKIISIVLCVLLLSAFSACSGDVPSTVNSLDDISGKTVGVLTGTVSDNYLSIYSGDITLKKYSSAEAASADLSAGVIDCIICPSGDTSSYTKGHFGLKVLKESFFPVSIGFMCARERGDLATVFSEKIASLTEAGVIGDIIGNYTGGRAYTYTPSENNTEGSLKAGAYVVGAPYIYYGENGKLTGIEIDITRAVCDSLGINVEFRDLERDDAESMVYTGNIDFAVGMFYPVDGAYPLVTFSQPYYTIEQSIITRK